MQKKEREKISHFLYLFQKEDFLIMTNNLSKEMPTPEVTDYLTRNWCNEKWGPFWSNYGRHFFHEDHETNNLVERYKDLMFNNI